MMPPKKMAEIGEEMAGVLKRVVYDPGSAIANALVPLSMADAPLDRPIIAISAWGQTVAVVWDDGRWRYGPEPGETWDADYPRAWIPLHACHWLNDGRSVDQ